MAEHFAELMRLLGYRHYCAQGGDWGAIITSELAARCRLGRGNGNGAGYRVPPFCAARHPESCVALHVFLGVLESWLDVSWCFSMFLGVDESQEYVRRKASAFYRAGLAEGHSHDTLLDKGAEQWMEMGRWRWIEMEEERHNSKANLQRYLVNYLVVVWVGGMGRRSKYSLFHEVRELLGGMVCFQHVPLT